jgi:hypothetical protein
MAAGECAPGRHLVVNSVGSSRPYDRLQQRVPLQRVTAAGIELLHEGAIDELVSFIVGAGEDAEARRAAQHERQHNWKPQ